nr:vegetative cell wall protein gp1-like [Crassostrea gigas]
MQLLGKQHLWDPASSVYVSGVNETSFLKYGESTHFTYQWNEEEQRFVRAQRRDPDPTEGAPQRQSAATQTVMEVQGVPQHQSSTTPTVSFAGTNFGLRPTVLFPRRPIGVTRPSSAPARPPAPSVISPVTVRPNTSLGQVYHTDGTVSAPEGLTGQRVNRSQKRTRDGGEENDEGEESPRSRASPDPSPPSSPRESPTSIVIPDTPPPSPPLANIRRGLSARPAPDRPAPTRPAPDRTAPPPPERPPPLRPAPDRPAPPPPIRPSSPQVPPPSSPMLITLINGENQRTFRAERNADDTEVRWTRVRDPSTVPVPENHTTIIRNGGASSSSSSRQFLNPTLAANHNETLRLLDRLERSVRRVVTRNHQSHHPIQNHQPFQYTHTRRPDNPREHYTIVPSWAVKAEDKRGQYLSPQTPDELRLRSQMFDTLSVYMPREYK